MIKVVDNFLPSLVQDDIENRLFKNDIPWFFEEETVMGESVPSKDLAISTPGFKHFLFDKAEIRSSLYEPFKKIFNLDFKNLLRAKINLLLQYPDYKSNNYNHPHVDFDEEHVTKIYYVNDCDGDTVFFEDDKKTIIKKVSPKKGRLVIFKNKIYHSGSNPIKNKKRIIININEKL